MSSVATVAQWVEGARPRTLPNAIAPVIAGTGAAAWLDAAVWWKALLALAVAVAMIVGVNYANDYSDGHRVRCWPQHWRALESPGPPGLRWPS
jgi:1,4-dihydroxy-2-naphthoate octaprenyltransferase